MKKITVQSSLMEDEDYEHSPSEEVFDHSKKRCYLIKKLLTSLSRDGTEKNWPLVVFCAALGPYCHNLGPIFPSTALALG